ncbi:MAG: bifunctional DNA-formamidopyrimidine glycosylase/DNA-(apurinic or apyrimidinic site) lyase [Alphaproteobacteria bacterium]
MPELPEVETIKNAIEKAIKQATITDVLVRNPNFREKTQEDFAQKIKGAKIISYQRFAKYILISLSNNYSLIWHLGMSGRVKIYDKRPENLEKYDHIIIETTNGVLVYQDARRFGLLIYVQTEDILQNKLLKNLGIDPFDKELNGKYLHERLQKKQISIKISLLDQTIINGIGNIYASEILFLAKILPTRKSNEINLKECESIVEATRIVLTKAIEAGGSTLKDYQKPDGSLGYFQNSHCVYNKTGQRCENCSCNIKVTGGIKKIVQAGRSTFYCPIKQK